MLSPTTPIVEKEEKTEYNLDIHRISKEAKQLLNNTKLSFNVKRLFNEYLTSGNVEIKNDLEVPMRYICINNK